MVDPLKPKGGFLRTFGCAEFIKLYLLGKEPYSSSKIDPRVGACQSEIFREYKEALAKAAALDRAVREEEKAAKREKRIIDPENIERLAERILSRLSYKRWGCRYHSFVTYFSNLVRLGWVEATGQEESSEFQEHYPPGQPKKYFRLTTKGKKAGDAAWANPHRALYGRK
jgi:hypothetical protein